MSERGKNQGSMQTPAHEPRLEPPQFSSNRPELSPELQKYLHFFGPMPKRSLEAFADMGLSDAEIGHYYKMPHSVVAEFRKIWKI